ncbi:MAG TPA: DUF6600 domain-containing protein [Blastocatellia bacterium]|nr:DUF6600 domain-containing protein [Blastocatellia bacterium]
MTITSPGRSLAVVLLAGLCTLALADERIVHVARISVIEGEVNYQRAGDGRADWFDATVNMPLDENDQVYTGASGRAEIQFLGRNLARVDRDTNLRIIQFNPGTVQLALSIGTATIRVESLDRRQFPTVDANAAASNDPIYFEVDTPTAAVTLLKEGVYRINVREDGTTDVIVRRGEAEVYNRELGTISVKQGRRVIVEGRDQSLYRMARVEEKDEWDRWNDRRDEALAARGDSASARYVPSWVPGVDDLDNYGEWWETPDYGYVWSPRGTAGDWGPYRVGCWRWYPSHGWTWVSYEPWGWVPYHYGRWAHYRGRWCWVPHSGVTVAYSAWNWSWSPALVVFCGWGGNDRAYREGYRDGYRRGYRDGRHDWIGWVPLGPGEQPERPGRVPTARDMSARRIESLRNFSAPGGVSALDGRRFAQPRVVVDNLAAPPQETVTARNTAPAPVSGETFKPTEREVARTRELSPVAARAVAAPVVTRLTPSAAPAPRRMTGSVPGVERGPGAAAAPEGRPAERSIRAPEYRTVERPAPPVRRPAEERGPAVERGQPARESYTPRQSAPPPSDAPRHSPPPRQREEPRRIESPSRSPVERSAPREVERPSSPPRESAPPPRSVERPSSPRPERQRESPPPPRESPPSRSPERPSSPPAERSMERPAAPSRSVGDRKAQP